MWNSLQRYTEGHLRSWLKCKFKSEAAVKAALKYLTYFGFVILFTLSRLLPHTLQPNRNLKLNSFYFVPVKAQQEQLNHLLIL